MRFFCCGPEPGVECCGDWRPSGTPSLGLRCTGVPLGVEDWLIFYCCTVGIFSTWSGLEELRNTNNRPIRLYIYLIIQKKISFKSSANDHIERAEWANKVNVKCWDVQANHLPIRYSMYHDNGLQEQHTAILWARCFYLISGNLSFWTYQHIYLICIYHNPFNIHHYINKLLKFISPNKS